MTESSEHNAEYTPYWIKSSQPEMIEEFNIPLDEYPRRCEGMLARWDARRREILQDKRPHQHSIEKGEDGLAQSDRNNSHELFGWPPLIALFNLKKYEPES